MKYRAMGKMDLEVSALGFGTMRLPVAGEDKDIDEPTAIAMIRHAIDQGVNYVDSAHGYHGGNSEVLVGKALRDGYRTKVRVATKLPLWDVKKLEDCDRLLNEQLGRLQMDRVDLYLLHCLTGPRWDQMKQLGVMDWMESVKADGRIGAIGFSFHDSLDAFRRIVDDYDWPFCQIQYNFVNEDVQAGTEGLQYAAAKGLAVIVMEPLFGGTLAQPPEPVQEIWDAAPGGSRPVDMALRWLWNKPEVSLVLSGMSTMEQVEQNLHSAERSGVGALTDAELQLVARVQSAYRDFSPIPCTKCRYCSPCPNGVDIPGNFELYNNGMVFQGTSFQLCKNLYKLMPEGQRADKCIQCGECEAKCPQQIEIGRQMQRVAAEME